MAGSNEHWRDVYSVDSWKAMLAKTEKSIPTGKPASDLQSLTMALAAYHDIPKAVSKNIPLRIQKLRELAKQAEALERLIAEGGGPVAKSVVTGRGEVKGIQKSAYRGGFLHKQEDNIGPWVHSLSRRATKKANYLQMLSESKNVGCFESTGALANKIATRGKKEIPAEQLRLTPGTKLEKMDFLHRDFEHQTDSDGSLSDPRTKMSAALISWLGSGSTENFFVWLEDHPICTADRHFNNLGFVPVNRVIYGNDPGVRRVYLLGGKLVAHPFQSTDAVTNLTTVRGTKAGEAFVWLVDGTLLVHSHLSGKFHHSSFNGGRKVLCAGTMEVIDGKLKGIDNNSGHYQPSDAHYLTFVDLLDKKGAVGSKTLFGTHGINDPGGSPFAPMWNLSLEEYRKRATKKGVAPFPVNPTAANGLAYG